MKWVIIKGVRYPISVVSAFAAYYGDNPFLKIRIRNKYHIIYFDNMDYLNIQIRYLINNYPDFVQIGNWYISKKQVMSWGPKGQAVDGSGWVDGEWGKIGLDGSCQNKRKSSIFKEPDGSIHDVDAFSKVPVKKFLFATRTWTENIHKIGWIGGLFETDENGILTGRYFGRCNVKDYQNGYMPKGKKEIPCREIEISPDNWIMTVESNNEALIELSKIYDIVWRQCPCLKGIMNTNVTPELERLACEQMKG